MLLQRLNYPGSKRFDTPDAKLIEEFGAADWEQFILNFISDTSLVVSGFDITDPYTLVTKQISSVDINIANSIVFHPNAVDKPAGFYVGASDAAVSSVSLSSNSTNYIELDTTSASGAAGVRAFWDKSAAGGQGEEFTATVDTAIFLEVSVTSNTSGFTSGKVPLMKVVVSSAGVITSIEDCRNLMFRLGRGGATPDTSFSFEWPDVPNSTYARTDSPTKITTTSSAINPFEGSDKNIRNLKEWMDAVMSRIKELSGAGYWFQGGSSSTPNYSNIVWDLTSSVLASPGAITVTSAPSGPGSPVTVAWTQPLYIRGLQGKLYYKIDPASISLDFDAANDPQENEVGYISLVRDQPLSSGLAVEWYSTTVINGVGGGAGAFAGMPAFSGADNAPFIRKTTDGISYYVQVLHYKDGVNGAGSNVDSNPELAKSIQLNVTYTGTVGSGVFEKAVYTQTEYTSIAVAQRQALSEDANFYWIAYREDTATATSRVYLRGLSAYDNLAIYCGQPLPTDTTPDYLGISFPSSDPANDSPLRLVSGGADTRDYPGAAGDTLTERLSLLSSQMADRIQDRAVSVVGGDAGGNPTVVSWDHASGNLTFNLDVKILLPGQGTIAANTIDADSYTVGTGFGRSLYCQLQRNTAANISASVTGEDSLDVPLEENIFVLARRGWSTQDQKRIYLWNGMALDDGESAVIGRHNVLRFNETISGAKTLLASDSDKHFYCDNNAAAFTLPALADVTNGSWFYITNSPTTTCTIARASTDTIFDGSATSFTLSRGATIKIGKTPASASVWQEIDPTTERIITISATNPHTLDLSHLGATVISSFSASSEFILPPASNCGGKCITVVNKNSISADKFLLVTPNGTDVFSGNRKTLVLRHGQKIRLTSDGSGIWYTEPYIFSPISSFGTIVEPSDFFLDCGDSNFNQTYSAGVTNLHPQVHEFDTLTLDGATIQLKQSRCTIIRCRTRFHVIDDSTIIGRERNLAYHGQGINVPSIFVGGGGGGGGAAAYGAVYTVAPGANGALPIHTDQLYANGRGGYVSGNSSFNGNDGGSPYSSVVDVVIRSENPLIFCGGGRGGEGANGFANAYTAGAPGGEGGGILIIITPEILVDPGKTLTIDMRGAGTGGTELDGTAAPGADGSGAGGGGGGGGGVIIFSRHSASGTVVAHVDGGSGGSGGAKAGVSAFFRPGGDGGDGGDGWVKTIAW